MLHFKEFAGPAYSISKNPIILFRILFYKLKILCKMLYAEEESEKYNTFNMAIKLMKLLFCQKP
jgi:hypothetical protein